MMPFTRRIDPVLARFLASTCRGVAVVAAIFCVAVATILVANFVQAAAVKPLESPALEAMREQYRAAPGDDELAGKIRALDLAARRLFFTRQWQNRTAAIVLIAGAAVLIVCLRAASALSKRLPKPLPGEGDALRPVPRAARIALTATGGVLLAGALERAAAGDVVLVAGFGQGCDAIVLGATGRGAGTQRKSGLAAALARGLADGEYVRFLSNCGLVEMDWGMRAERDNRTSQAAAWRRHRDVTAFVGGRCSACGTIQFPRSQACVNPDCRAFGTQEDHALAESTARIKTFTEDWLAFTRAPPLVYGNVTFDVGGNLYTEFTDTLPGELAIGMPVRFAFRVKDFDRARGFRRYAWKATPARN